MQRNSFKPIDTVALKTRHQSMDTLWAQLASTAKAHALRPALIHGNESILYGDLAVKVDTARVALSSLQLAPGQRCAIVAEKNSDVVVAILAALHLRVVLVIIHPILKAQQISHILRDSGATALMCNSRKTEQLVLEGEIPASLKQWVMMPERSARHDTPDKEQIPDDHPFHNTGTANSETGIIVHDWQKMIAHSQATRRDIIAKPESDELAVILYTSGSTGMPKGVMLSHSNLYHGALSVTTYLKNNEHDRILALMPFSFDYGLSQLTTAMFSGAALILHDYMMPRGVIDLVGKLKITGIPAVPHVWDQLVKTDWPDTEHLRYITNTGGRLQLPTIEKLRQKLPDTAIYSMYGFTEAFRATFLYPDQLAQRPDSIGKAVPYADVLIVDSEGNELNAFERGELIQSGPLVSQGYWNDPTGTAARIRPRYVEDTSDTVFAWSGDEAYKDDEGYIYFVSRKDDLVKLNGYRVSPSEIEMTLLSCPWINEVCILCVPDDHFGNVAIAFVVLASPASHSDLTNWCKSTLPSFMVPARWTVLDKLPVTPNNKIDRAALASIEGNVQAAPTRHN